MQTVTSRDGTTIAYDRTGTGPAVILVTGALGSRVFDPLNAPLTALLAPQFTVYRYDRRGRGDSGDTLPYAVDREVDDVEALVAQAGGSAYLYGISSGAVLALHAARRLPGVTRLALFEPPFIVDGGRPPRPADYQARIEQACAAGDPGEAVAVFMRFLGLPDEAIAPMREEPFWPAMAAAAHTLAYDAAVMGDSQRGQPLPADRWSTDTPTLVVDGAKSEPFLHTAADAIAGLLPDARRHTLTGQDHAVTPDAIAPVLRDFFTETR
ncbi:MAG: alpha/beta fold hydrolase [Micromonosporaceae bacterium]|nr:alpha/beta fold hydrolase [Micromonosporaceae bacterium]